MTEGIDNSLKSLCELIDALHSWRGPRAELQRHLPGWAGAAEAGWRGLRAGSSAGASATEGEPSAKGEDKASESSSHTTKGHTPVKAQARRANQAGWGQDWLGMGLDTGKPAV